MARNQAAATTAPRTIIAYYRVSTAKQGASGLGLEAQRHAVDSYLAHVNHGARRLAEFTEIESGRKRDRPQLHKALERCKLTGATLVIARLDRLSRNASFLLSLKAAGVPFVACDNPHADNFTVGLLALIAEREAETISRNTKLALQAAKARGITLGSPLGAAAFGDRSGWRASAAIRTAKAEHRAIELRDTILELNSAGVNTLAALASALNERQVQLPGDGRWHPMTVSRLLKRLDLAPG
jgi:DNA invertase Pin-like site-specific DNA recombinase